MRPGLIPWRARPRCALPTSRPAGRREQRSCRRRIAETVAGKIAAHVDPQAEKLEARIEAARAKVSTLGAFIDDRYGQWALEHLRRGDVAVARLKADFEK